MMVCYAVQHNLPQSAGGTSGLRPYCVATSAGSFIGEFIMKRIPLNHNKFAIVDDEDYDFLMQWKWRAEKDGYTFYATRVEAVTVCTGIKKKRYFMHRIITSCPVNKQVDHANHDGLDNRKCNLRVISSGVNQQNMIKTKPHSSIYKGVCWASHAKSWRGQITFRYKRHHLGYFKDEARAAKAYDKKAKELFGEFACLNFAGDNTA